jgi:deoxyribodipyrimidine photo-lyase
VDAAMREMYVTGIMQNRGRMIVASYLTKHLMSHWKIGLDWFEDCLIDWDPASNAMGWQWSAGSGPDATPYFRVFNPDTQAEKFDKARVYRSRYLGELFRNHEQPAEDYYAAIPRAWKLSIKDAYPAPVVALDVGRNRALAAYKDR